MPSRILFVCVENSCRSQMAEAFAREIGGERVEAASAGSRPSGLVDPRTVRFMEEKDIRLDAQSSKGLDSIPAGEWDYVITMGCGDACPWVPAKHREDWDLSDPKKLSDDEFRAVRDEIEKRVRELLASATA